MSVSEFMEKQRMTGDLEEFTLTGLLPKTGYVVFVCGMDEYGRPTTDVSVKDFETLEYVASDATVESVDVRLYDGEEASSIDPTTYKPMITEVPISCDTYPSSPKSVPRFGICW